MKLTTLFNQFFNSEKSGGILLIFCTIISLVLANFFLRDSYIQIWQTYIGSESIAHWINDGLMAIFFLLIGLELEREIYIGELSNLKNASFPIVAALGGMVVPAGLFLIINWGSPSQAGAGIPMATDIAFAIGILSLLGSRVPSSLKILLTAIAVIDDLGAIIIIAIFYTTNLSWSNLGIAVAIFGFLCVLNRLKVHNLIPYLVLGVIMWYFMLHSGVHATVAGVMLAFTIPFGNGGEKSPSYILQSWLHTPVAYIILPLFALANTAIAIEPNWYQGLLESNSIGIITGLVAGKPLGIVLFSFIAVAVGICTLPQHVKWKHVAGVGFLAGVGFTMSIFITLLAYNQPHYILSSKIAIIIASVLVGTLGFFWLKTTLPKKWVEIED